MNDDYKGASASDLSTMTNYSLTGTSPSIIAARVSYVYNLLGPSMSIDTACSSALVAIDVAVQSLKTGMAVLKFFYENIFCLLTNKDLNKSLVKKYVRPLSVSFRLTFFLLLLSSSQFDLTDRQKSSNSQLRQNTFGSNHV